MKFVPVRFVRQGFLGVLFLGFCFVLAGTAAAQNQYYVSNSGNDTNEGSQARPWRTLQHANSVARLGSGGTVVHIANGSYSGSFNLNKAGTSDSSRFEWRCDNQSNSTKTWPCLLNGSLTLSGAFSNLVGFDITNNDAYMVIGTANFQRFENNRIHDSSNVCTDNGGAGINLSSGTSAPSTVQGTVIIGNVIFNVSTGAGGWGNRCHGLYINASNSIFENNLIYNNHQGYGIKYVPNSIQVGNSVISNNTLWGNGGSNFCPGGPTPCSATNTAGGCIIMSQDRTSQDPFNMSVNNNICYQNPGTFQGLNFFNTTGAGSELNNNLMFGNGSNAISGLASGTSFSAPNFTNFKADGSGDYTPTSSRPLMGGGSATCSSGGIASCVPAIDFVGVARVSQLDIGALAHGSSTASGVPSAPTGLTASVQ